VELDLLPTTGAVLDPLAEGLTLGLIVEEGNGAQVLAVRPDLASNTIAARATERGGLLGHSSRFPYSVLRVRWW
jgi:hypothetical protein